MSDFVSRRSLVALLAGGLSVAGGSRASAKSRERVAEGGRAKTVAAPAQALGLVADSGLDQSSTLQSAIDQAALNGVTLQLPPGRIRASRVALRERSHIVGSGRTVLQGVGNASVLTGERANGVCLERVRIEGDGEAGTSATTLSVIEFRQTRGIVLRQLTVVRAPRNGIYLEGCSGRVETCRISNVGAAALWAMDSQGLEIVGNTIETCADNGILVWRSAPGEDGTLISQNRISRISVVSGGSGQNGNGVNVFRASRVRVMGNDISDCAYSAVRGNSASDIQIVANNVARIGEVALYAEFGFQGALIAQNLVNGAASGISVTNFNEGGRLAVIQGNLVRNLRRREHESVDKRGEGISVEADAAVTGNTIEGAPSAGIVIGWGPHMRNVNATGNVIRDAGVGILISDGARGSCLVAQNLIAGARNGAIRLMDHGRPIGGDLASAPPKAGPIAINGNVVATDQ